MALYFVVYDAIIYLVSANCSRHVHPETLEEDWHCCLLREGWSVLIYRALSPQTRPVSCCCCCRSQVTPLFVGVLYGAFLYSIYVDGNLKKRVPSIKDAEWAIYRMKLSFIVPIQVPSRPINWRRSFYDVITSVRSGPQPYLPGSGPPLQLQPLVHVPAC